MAFNFNYFKGATTQQIQHSIQYWMNALRPAEEVDKMKEEKAAEIVENAVIYPVDEQVGEESPVEREILTVPLSDPAVPLYE
jgi:hypothetical protein